MENILELVKTFVNSGITFFESGLMLMGFLLLPILAYMLLMEGIRIFDYILLTKFHRYRANSTYVKLKKRGWNVEEPPKFEDPVFSFGVFEKEEEKK